MGPDSIEVGSSALYGLIVINGDNGTSFLNRRSRFKTIGRNDRMSESQSSALGLRDVDPCRQGE